MNPSISAIWRTFNTPIEGLVQYMYLDKKGLVTIGMGNLIDPMSVAAGLPFTWRNKPGKKISVRPPGKTDIEAEWKSIKGKPELATKGWRACDSLCNLELALPAIDALITAKLTENETILKRNFAGYALWPADAQMGLLSMAWSMGPAFKFPKFHAACNAQDFATAAKECTINAPGDNAVAMRNTANQIMFRNAAIVVAEEKSTPYNRNSLYYPRVLVANADWAVGSVAYGLCVTGMPTSTAIARLQFMNGVASTMFASPLIPKPLKQKLFSTAYLTRDEFYKLADATKTVYRSMTNADILNVIGSTRLEVRQYPTRFVVR